MKRLIFAFAIIFGWTSVDGAAAEPVALNTLQAVHNLSNAQANKALPVAFEATVTYTRAYENTLFVQDGNVAIYVRIPTNTKLLPGDRILVQGTSHANFRPDVVGEKITLLHHGAVPKPVPVLFDELSHARYDSILVSVRGVVRAADQVLSPRAPVLSTRMNIFTDEGEIDAYIDSDDARTRTELLDAEVQVTGVAWGKFDGKYQLTGANLYVSSLASVKVLKRSGASPWSLPITPMDQIFSGYHIHGLTQRTRVQGTITYYQPGLAMVLQDGSKSLWIETQTRNPLRIGDLADATGFPDVHSGFLTLTHGEVQDRHLQAPIKPLDANWKQITSSRHIFDLVTIEGQVVTAVREASQDEYVLVSNGYVFSAIYRHQKIAGALGFTPMKQIPLGSRVRVTGVCVMEGSDPYDRDVPFNLLMRSFDDIVIVAKPSMLNVLNLVIMLSLMLVVVIAVGAWGWTLRAKVRHQTGKLAAMAQFEQRRSRILEDINGSKPLAEILEQTTEMISFLLHGAPCWCLVKDGEQLGANPPDADRWRILHEEIAARSGVALGTLYAAFDLESPPSAMESEALSEGARLATLAMETRRLYSELRHRSEFDLLTDVPNRFAMEKFMEVRIEAARQSGGVLGLIYIDLDKFKPINDTYGHHVGDLFLQEVAARMGRQLLGGDMLARLGGDEFAALVALQHGRFDLDKIIARLERCFEDPFLIEGYSLHGAASFGIALYPQDGANKDSLLSAADAAMYAIKNRKRQSEMAAAQNTHFPVANA